jgi:hypothetical protein
MRSNAVIPALSARELASVTGGRADDPAGGFGSPPFDAKIFRKPLEKRT